MGNVGIHLMVGFQGTTLDSALKALIRDYGIGGIVLFRRNIESSEQLQELVREAQEYALSTLRRPLWVAIDQEGGPVQRLPAPYPRFPSARNLAIQGPAAVSEWTSRAAVALRRLGILINLAPVLDVVSHSRPNFMEERSLGADPQSVAFLGRIWIRSLQENGVSATAKHYPGLGQAELDPHHFAPVIHWRDNGAMQRDLLPFGEAIREGVHCLMTSHALYPSLDSEWPATLSPTISHLWLRRRLGFEGVLLSDDMDMAAISEKYSWSVMAEQGMLSSIDFFLLCQNSGNIEPFYRALSDAVRGNPQMTDAHEKSLVRIRHLFDKHGLTPGDPKA